MSENQSNENLEENVEFAHKVGLTLNHLIDDMVLILDIPQDHLLYEIRLLNQRPDLDDETPRHMQLTREDSFYTDLAIDWRHFCLKEEKNEAVDLVLQVAGITNTELFLKELELDEHLPFWGYFPKNVYFVGNLDDISETEVNEHIQSVLSSTDAVNFK